MSLASADSVYLEAFREGLRLEPRLTVTEWADAERILPIEATAQHGRYESSRTPYLIEIGNRLSVSDPCERVILMKGTQIGATEVGNNWLGYLMHHAPAPTLMAMATLDQIKLNARTRIETMVAMSPALSERYKPEKSSLFEKHFRAGGLLVLKGANTSTGLRSMPVRNLLLDEAEVYPGDIDGEGDPISLAEARTDTFRPTGRKIFIPSTPKTKGFSRIESLFKSGDQRRYYVPCPECGEMDWIRLERIQYLDDNPETTALLCHECGSLIDEREKMGMLARGEWRATAEGRPLTHSYHLSALYSPWKTWANCVEQWLDAQGDPIKLKTVVNTVLAETYEDRSGAIDIETLKKEERRTVLERRVVPHGVGVIMAAWDIQDTWVEGHAVGFGSAEQSWILDHQRFDGDPSDLGEDSVWERIDEWRKQPFKHESGRIMRIYGMAVDTGGHNTDQAYQFVKPRQRERVYAVKGGRMKNEPIVKRPTTNNRLKVKLYTLCVDTAKEKIHGRLRIQRPGPGYIHIPSWLDEEYVKQLGGERAAMRLVPGKGYVREWLARRARVEALDLWVYTLAALYIQGPMFLKSLAIRAARASKPPKKGEKPPEETSGIKYPKQLQRQVRRRRNWVMGGRRR